MKGTYLFTNFGAVWIFGKFSINFFKEKSNYFLFYDRIKIGEFASFTEAFNVLYSKMASEQPVVA
jgi:hypothetical protein